MECVEILSALLTPVIAIIAVYIAYRQYQIEKSKLNLELYDRRLHIYEEVKKIISIIVQKASAEPEEMFNFRSAVSEADFLFDSDITDYIQEIWDRGFNLIQNNQLYSRSPSPQDYDHEAVTDAIHQECMWFADQFEPVKSKFKKYLTLG